MIGICDQRAVVRGIRYLVFILILEIITSVANPIVVQIFLPCIGNERTVVDIVILFITILVVITRVTDVIPVQILLTRISRIGAVIDVVCHTVVVAIIGGTPATLANRNEVLRDVIRQYVIRLLNRSLCVLEPRNRGRNIDILDFAERPGKT